MYGILAGLKKSPEVIDCISSIAQPSKLPKGQLRISWACLPKAQRNGIY